MIASAPLLCYNEAAFSESRASNMANIYLSDDALLRDYGKLSREYKNKAGRYIKNLLKIQRAESGLEQEYGR